MKIIVGKHHLDVQLAEGDLVYFKLRPSHLRSLANKPNKKLGPKYFGPFEVLKCIGQVHIV